MIDIRKRHEVDPVIDLRTIKGRSLTAAEYRSACSIMDGWKELLKKRRKI